MSALLIFSFFSFLSLTQAGDDRRHGLVNEAPILMSPAAYDFFHNQNGIRSTNVTNNNNSNNGVGAYCDSSNYSNALPPSATTTTTDTRQSTPITEEPPSSLPISTTMQTTPASESPSSLPVAATVQSGQTGNGGGGWKPGAGGIAGISLGFLFVCLLGMGVYRVTVKKVMKTKQEIVEV